MSLHELKTLPPYFHEIWIGNKNFEIRFNDRNFRVGDTLILKEWDDDYTGRYIICHISYITNFEQKSNFVVMAIKNIGQRWMVVD